MITKACMCKPGLHGEKVKVTTDAAKNIISVSGNGIVLGSCCLDCDTAYWEIVVGKNPENIDIGVKKYSCNKGESVDSAVLGESLSDNSYENFPSWWLKEGNLKEGDVVGVYWDQTDFPMLSFWVNGKPQPSYAINRIRPTENIFPAVSVKSGSNCCLIFDGESFAYPPKGKFGMIICSTKLI
jgi:hypothetical protein